MIDEGFIQRTCRTTLVVWGVAVFACLVFQLWFAAVGFTIGTAVSLGVLIALNRIIRRTVVPGAKRVGITLAKFGAIKFLAIAAIVFGVVMTRRFDIIVGFCAGIALTQVVMFLKVIGMALIERMGE